MQKAKFTLGVLATLLALPILMSANFKVDASLPEACMYLIIHRSADQTTVNIETTSRQAAEAHQRHGDVVYTAICD